MRADKKIETIHISPEGAKKGIWRTSEGRHPQRELQIRDASYPWGKLIDGARSLDGTNLGTIGP